MRLNGVIIEFNETTWWGRVSYDLEVLDFHGTSVCGMNSDCLPKVGQKVTIVLNNSHRLLSVELL